MKISRFCDCNNNRTSRSSCGTCTVVVFCAQNRCKQFQQNDQQNGVPETGLYVNDHVEWEAYFLHSSRDKSFEFKLARSVCRTRNENRKLVSGFELLIGAAECCVRVPAFARCGALCSGAHSAGAVALALCAYG